MIKGEEQKPVHPGNVGNHLRAGWRLAEEPAQESLQEPDTSVPVVQQTVAVETPAAEDSAAAAPLASVSEDPV